MCRFTCLGVPKNWEEFKCIAGVSFLNTCSDLLWSANLLGTLLKLSILYYHVSVTNLLSFL